VPSPVLVVEDDQDVRDMLAIALELDGIRVLTAANGRDGFALAQSQRPALIVLDLMMPIMTGEQFRVAQLADETIRDIPVIVVSAHHDAPQIAHRLKAAAWLSKPIDIEALQVLVRQWR